MKNKRFTLTFFIRIENGIDILEDIQCDYWFPVADDSLSVIYCMNDKKDSSVGYPISSLRKIKQNFGVQEMMDEEPYQEKSPEGYN